LGGGWCPIVPERKLIFNEIFASTLTVPVGKSNLFFCIGVGLVKFDV